MHIYVCLYTYICIHPPFMHADIFDTSSTTERNREFVPVTYMLIRPMIHCGDFEAAAHHVHRKYVEL